MRYTLPSIMVASVLSVAPVFGGAARAGDVLIYDFASPYLQRMDRITPGAGDASAVNTVTHMISPWPPNVGNRHIRFDAERMAGAYERYRDVKKLPLAPPPIAPTPIATSGFSSGSGGTSTSTTSTGSR
jgi:hypothetical protein